MVLLGLIATAALKGLVIAPSTSAPLRIDHNASARWATTWSYGAWDVVVWMTLIVRRPRQHSFIGAS